MNRIHCEREKEIIDAMRCASLDGELRRHASECAICIDTAAVSEFLQGNRTVVSVLPAPDFLWWKGQLACKQMAVERATRSITLVQRISYLCVGAVMGWLLFASGYVPSFLNGLSKRDIWSTGVLGESALLMGVAALFFALLGCLYLARSEE